MDRPVKSLQELARPQVLGLIPYSPGKPIEEVEREIGLDEVLKLASNENPLGPSPLALQAIREVLHGLHRYPDGGCHVLRHRLSRRLEVDPQQLCFGNGSNELLELVARAFLGPEDEALIGHPAFVVYRSVCQAVGCKIGEIPLKDFTFDLPAMLKAVTVRTKVIFLGNPNNPTGTCVSPTLLNDFVQELPRDVIVVVDEAYREYVPRYLQPDLLRYVREGRYIATLGTFSKAYGLAGLRIGYGVAPAEMVEILNRVRQPFNVNALAQRAAVAALDDAAHLEETIRVAEEGRRSLQARFAELGLSFVPSVANFVLVDVGASGAAVAGALLRKGVIVRSMEGYGLPTYIRVTVGTARENAQVVHALTEVLAEVESAVRSSDPTGGRRGR
ncbi:MAG: histidinol-phosphate transaminase [Candidatus Methylomirabilales bacterium]